MYLSFGLQLYLDKSVQRRCTKKTIEAEGDSKFDYIKYM